MANDLEHLQDEPTAEDRMAVVNRRIGEAVSRLLRKGQQPALAAHLHSQGTLLLPDGSPALDFGRSGAGLRSVSGF